MSLTYSPELLRQHEAHKAARARIDGAAKPIELPKPKPIVVVLPVSVEKPVEIVQSAASFRERDWLIVAPPNGIKEIIKEVCRQYNVSKIDIESARRTWGIVQPRQVAMSLAKHLTHKSLPEIGRMMGGRDHTTVLHACRKMQPIMDEVAARISADAAVSDWVSAYRAQIKITAPAPYKTYRPMTV